jgi:hypothetical protein
VKKVESTTEKIDETDDSGVKYTKNYQDSTNDETDWDIDSGLAAEKARQEAIAAAAKKSAEHIAKKLAAKKKKKLTTNLYVGDSEDSEDEKP